ncbi:MAG TPA: hypothetical protein VK102_08845 [Sphingobacterium sp.]|nr:hypothetical protein [Sphingobacterium sp.]
MKHYSVTEAFHVLQKNKITTQEESVRRWLREGTLRGFPPPSWKQGWVIREDDLYAFIKSRLPDTLNVNDFNTTKDAIEDKETIRAEMWWELARKFIFEGFVEPKKMRVRACIQHKGYSKELETYIWKAVSQHTLGYAKPHIPYLLDAFLFDGHRIKLNPTYEAFEEQVLFALIEHLRRKKVRQEPTNSEK